MNSDDNPSIRGVIAPSAKSAASCEADRHAESSCHRPAEGPDEAPLDKGVVRLGKWSRPWSEDDHCAETGAVEMGENDQQRDVARRSHSSFQKTTSGQMLRQLQPVR